MTWALLAPAVYLVCVVGLSVMYHRSLARHKERIDELECALEMRAALMPPLITREGLYPLHAGDTLHIKQPINDVVITATTATTLGVIFQ